MERKVIRLTESDLHRIIVETANQVLNEGLSYTQLKNVLGVEDNDEWNAASDAERKEELEGTIFKALGSLAGGNPRSHAFRFKDAVELLDREFGFKYQGSDEEEEAHIFSNGQDELTLYPNTFYPSQGNMSLFNMHLS